MGLDAATFLRSIPDQSVEMVLTDPPYDFSEEQKKELHAEFLRIAKGTVIVFAPPENPWLLPAEQYLFWIKPISTKNTARRYSRFVECMYVYNGGKWNVNRHWSQYTNVFTDLVDDSSLHPFRKPPSLITRLVEIHTERGDTVVDPFMGSGVVGNVCRSLGRVCLETDIDPQYDK